MFFEGLCSLKCEVARGCFYYLHRPKYITESPGTTCSTQTLNKTRTNLINKSQDELLHYKTHTYSLEK